ncbi:uncharacterized protein FIBRA_00648 [Fibroporia radiculosa]|uniref:Uncharacterized protein n=1 Tax=Fibroporia radiculosa TaxID=599839 RepID=J4I820_9APHY|nr:uncharacterized protein FIBRA_00648 [Fibroporia radiculosa]CCL98646.1 predicted protein [Fibroporia radiculosa]
MEVKIVDAEDKLEIFAILHIRVALASHHPQLSESPAYASKNMNVSTYGRSRQSIADLEQELNDIFQSHPESHLSAEDEPVIPGNALVDVLRTFSRNHDAVELMTREEEDQLISLLETNPGLAVTPQVLLQFIAMRTTFSPHHSPEGSPPADASDFEERGRIDGREYDEGHSRSSSRDSTGTSIYRPSSRGPPKTPTNRESPFDTSRRQRSTPLGNIAPSSWTRRPPPSRRKSDAGSHSRALSDSESTSPPAAYGRTSGRSRAPSNPVSPTTLSPVGSPPFAATISRPHSRAQSQPQSHFSSLDGAMDGYHRRSSPERDFDYRTNGGLLSPPQSDRSESSFDEDDRFGSQISSLPMPRVSSDDDSEDDDDDSMLGLVMDRSAASSTVSLDLQERLEALQRMNTDLGRKLIEAEKTLQYKLAEHEMELEEMQSRLEEVKSELSATKREEKELRSKEHTNQSQISALESEIFKLQKSLDVARASYQSLQKQYQEQCAESERYRNTLRRRDQEVKDFQDAAALQAIETSKWVREQANYEERIAFFEGELAVAQQAQVQLEEQKQENMMLKETIDRMRFDMDEMRNGAASNHLLQGGSGSSSARNSVSKSLGAELLSKMKDGRWGLEDDEEEEEVSDQLEIEGGDEDTEGEDVVETIITRTKRKVASRAKRLETIQVEEVKEYSDTATQHDVFEFTNSCDVQTDPEPKILTASLNIQTEDLPLFSISIQTDPEPQPEPDNRPTSDVEVQTDDPQPVASTSSTPPLLEEEEDALASSSSTLLPPTPRAQSEDLHDHVHDLPPDYNQVTEHDRDELAIRVANETLKKWHKGLKLPIEPVQGGISEDAIEDWKALKEELGIECSAIDRIVEESSKTGMPRPSRDGEHSRRRRSRFYNIYNTYVYDGAAPMSTSQFLFCIGASAAVAFLVGQAMAPPYVPGGATYYDRAAWSSFNSIQATGEGFPGDAQAAVWGFLGRLGGGAARTLRGWPT